MGYCVYLCVFVSQPPLCSYFDDVYLHPRVLIITETKKYLYAMSLVVCLSLGHEGFCIFPSFYFFEVYFPNDTTNAYRLIKWTW